MVVFIHKSSYIMTFLMNTNIYLFLKYGPLFSMIF